VVGGDGGVASLHDLEDLVHHLALVHAPVPGVGNKLIGLPDLGLVGGVHGVAQIVQGDAEGVPGVVDEQHVPGGGVVEHDAPAGDGLIHHGGVVDDAQGAPGVGHGVQVLRVVGQVLEPVVDLLKVGDLAVIQGLEHILLDELRDHIVRGDDDVVAGAAGLQRGVELLVAGRGPVVDLNAGLRLEVLDKTFVDILAPAAYVQYPLAPVAAVAAAGFAGAAGGITSGGIASVVDPLHGAAGQEQS